MKIKIKDIVESVSITHSFNKDKLHFLNTSDVLDGKIINDYVYDINELKGQAKKTIQNGDILFSEIRPKNRRFAVVNVKNPEDYVISTKLMVLRKFNEDIDFEYLYYSLTNEDFLDKLQRRAENRICSFPQITFDILGDYEIEFYDMDTQKKIAGILGNIDRQIERNNAMVQKLQVMAQTTYSRWFNQFEYPNADKELVFNKELGKEIPKSFTVKSLGEIIVESKKSTIQVNEARLHNGSYPFFTSGAEILPYKDYFVDGPYCFLNTGGNADVKFYDGKSAYSTDTWCLSANEYSYWLYLYLLNIKSNMDQLFFSGSGLKHLQKDVFKKQVICLPNKQLIEQFNLIVSKLFKYQSKIIQENKELVALKDRLLPLLINGQLNI